jgi:hypothetical protein
LSYGLDVDPVAQAQIRALPSDALVALAEVKSDPAPGHRVDLLRSYRT